MMANEADGLDGRDFAQQPISLAIGEPTFSDNQVRIPIILRIQKIEQPTQIDTGLTLDLETLEAFLSKLKAENK